MPISSRTDRLAWPSLRPSSRSSLLIVAQVNPYYAAARFFRLLRWASEVREAIAAFLSIVGLPAEQNGLVLEEIVPDASLLLQRLLRKKAAEPQMEDLFHSNLLLAGRCLAAHPRILQVSLRDEITSRLGCMNWL